MKKLVILMYAVITLISVPCGTILASSVEQENDNVFVGETVSPSDEMIKSEEDEESGESGEMSPAGDAVVGAVTRKDKKIAELTDKYNDKNLGTVAYYLDVVRYYSTPVFFVFLTIGAFNFFIVGNKKLDKKEQGFGWITACIIGWVFFQCIPLAFALFTL